MRLDLVLGLSREAQVLTEVLLPGAMPGSAKSHFSARTASLPAFGMLSIGARGATQVPREGHVHPEDVGQQQ